MNHVESIGSSTPFPRYVVISPVKDEERYVELTLQSMIRQTRKPALWVIVDDGSKDRTPEIINRYVDAHSFIRLIRNPHAGVRQPGSSVIRAFNYGYFSTGDVDYDCLVKLDCDLSFEPDYFEKLLGKFLSGSRLGIASGVYFEMDKAGVWNEIEMPFYHAAGACKVLRRKCFEEVGRFIISPGWDTVDEIRAMTLGWETCHFKDLQIKHHKAEGSGIGLIRTNIMHGDIYYLTGGSKLFFLLKVFHRMATKPYGLSALALLWGYLRAVIKQKPLLVTEAEARYYRLILRDRLWAQVRALLIWS